MLQVNKIDMTVPARIGNETVKIRMLFYVMAGSDGLPFISDVFRFFFLSCSLRTRTRNAFNSKLYRKSIKSFILQKFEGLPFLCHFNFICFYHKISNMSRVYYQRLYVPSILDCNKIKDQSPLDKVKTE